MSPSSLFISLFFFNDPPPTEIYTLSLHDALPIYVFAVHWQIGAWLRAADLRDRVLNAIEQNPAARVCKTIAASGRSEEHTSELQSRRDLVCRLLLEKKKKIKKKNKIHEEKR